MHGISDEQLSGVPLVAAGEDRITRAGLVPGLVEGSGRRGTFEEGMSGVVRQAQVEMITRASQELGRVLREHTFGWAGTDEVARARAVLHAALRAATPEEITAALARPRE